MPRTLTNVVRSRPGSAVLLVFLLLVVTGAGLYGYALRQWRAAQAAVKEGRCAEARANLKVCLFVWPQSVPVHILAARAARLSGDFEEAEAHLNRCLKLRKGATEDAELEFLLMRVQMGEVDAVAPTLFQCVDNKHPETYLILETLSRAYMHNLRYGPALACLYRWIEEMPDSAEPLNWRGWVLERLSDYTGAIRDYQRALELDPELVSVRLRLAELHLHLSNWEEALPHLERLNRQHPERADVMAQLGQCRFLQGKVKEARRLMEAAVEQLPKEAPLLVQLGKLEVQDGQPARAEHWLRRALEADPTDTEAQFVLVSSLRMQDRPEEADAALEQYRKNSAIMKRVTHTLQEEARHPTKDADGLYEVGTVFLQGGQDRLGVYWLHKALERDSDHQPTNQALAEYYEKKGEQAKADAHRKRLARSTNTATTAGHATKTPTPSTSDSASPSSAPVPSLSSLRRP